MQRFLTIGLCFISSLSLGQNLTISAQVIDKETKEPLVFASVGIREKSIGTITNLQGEFDFHVPANFRNDILFVSIIGYKLFEAPVWTLTENPNQVFELEKVTFILNEVVVLDSLSGGDVLHIALNRISQNYPAQPFLLDGFYRDIKKVGGTYISLLEAATKIYDEDFKAPRNKYKLRERVALLEVRRSIGYANKFTEYFDQENLLEDLLIHNDVRYRLFPEEDIFYESLTRGKDDMYNGREVYVISHNVEYHLEIIIDKKTFGIMHLEYESDRSDDINRKRGLYSKFSHVKRIVDFKYFNNKLFLNYITMESKLNWYDLKTNALKFATELDQSLLINNINFEPEERIGTTEKMRSYGLQYQDLPYNKEFWDNYNVIKESPLDQKIVSDLEKLGPLEKQFEEKN